MRYWNQIMMLMQFNGILQLIQISLYFNAPDINCEV